MDKNPHKKNNNSTQAISTKIYENLTQQALAKAIST
jgi:hypothetical protein